MGTVFIALSTFAEFNDIPLKMLRESGIPFSLHTSGKRITKEELISNAADATVIIAGVEKYDDDIFDALPKLTCIIRCGVGVDSINLTSAKKRNITVLNTPDTPTLAVAELALSMFLMLSRNILPQANSMKQKNWQRLEAHLLSGKTLGIFGFGRIGKKVAELAAPFKLKILVSDPLLNKDNFSDKKAELVNKYELLERADIISIHASNSSNKEPLIGAEDYDKMKKGAILVNLSRGGMIDEPGLIRALTSGQLAGAGMDVFTQEPYNGPLCDIPNVVLTPHSASLTVETRVAMETECAEKACRFLRGNISDTEKVI